MENKQKLPFIAILYRILILFYLCWGSHAWFTWWADFTDKNITIALNIIFFLIAECYRRRMSIVLKRDKRIGIAVLCLVIAVVSGTESFGPLLIPNTLLRIYPLYVLLSDKDNAPSILSFLVTSMSVILVPGLIMHIIDLTVGMPISVPSVYGESYAYIFFNYFFLLKPIAEYEAESGRFFSIFIEPGYLGILLSFPLYASKFDLTKKQTWILICGLIASFSLFGIVSSLVGYILIRLSKDLAVKKIVLFILLSLPVYYFGVTYNNGNNIINSLIIERLQPDDEKGISGNNRVGEVCDAYFDQMVADGSILYGMGYTKAEKMLGDETGIHGAGFKFFCIINGALSAVLFLLFYFYVAPRRYIGKNKIYLWGLFLIYILAFFTQATPLATTWLTCYMLGYANDSNEKAIYQ